MPSQIRAARYAELCGDETARGLSRNYAPIMKRLNVAIDL
jgi:hypothetical protein